MEFPLQYGHVAVGFCRCGLRLSRPLRSLMLANRSRGCLDGVGDDIATYSDTILEG